MTGARSFLRTARLGDVESGRDNNLNLIRFLLASAVVFSHSYVSLGLYALEPMQRFSHYYDLGTVAVFSFFFISGFLILKSGLRWRSPEDFIVSRALRIFPGLIVAVILCVFVFGPLDTTDPLSEYARSPLTRHYLSEMWMHRMQHLLPGVATSYALPSLNAPLWTLPGEWTMYMAVLVVCLMVNAGSLRSYRVRSWLFLAGALTITAQMLPLPWPYAYNWIKFFCIGSVCYLIRRWISLSVPMAVVLLLAEIPAILHAEHFNGRFFPLVLSYSVLTFAYHPAVQVRWFHQVGDYSYGLYIYAHPIQQSFVPHFRDPLALFLASYPIALSMAVLSWHFMEKPCLAQKHRIFGEPRPLGTRHGAIGLAGQGEQSPGTLR